MMAGKDDLELAAMELLDKLPDPMLLFDIESFAILAVNEAAIERYGYDRDELLGRTIMDLRPAEEVARISPLARRLLSGVDAAGRSLHRTKSGETFVADVHTRLVTQGGRRLKLSVIRDVTSLVAMEEESRARLAEAERRRVEARAVADHFHRLLNLAPGRLLVLEPGDHRIVAASDAYLAAVGRTRQSLVGRRLSEALAGDPAAPAGGGLAALAASLARVEALGRTDTMPAGRYPLWPLADAGGAREERDVRVVNTPVPGPDGKLAGIVHRLEDAGPAGAAADGGEAGRAAVGRQAGGRRLELWLRTRELEAAKARLAEQTAILESAERLLGIGTWSLDLATDRLDWSNAVFAIYGLPAGSPVSREDYIAMVHEGDRPQMVGELDRFLASGDEVFAFEHRIRRPDGSLIQVRGAAEYADRPGGRVLSGFVQDITAIRVAESKARRSADLLRLASRMARFGGWRVDLATGRTEWTEGTAAIHDSPGTTHVDVQTAIDFYPPDYRDFVSQRFYRCAEEGTPFDEVMQIVTAKGRRTWVHAIGEAERDSAGRIVAVHGAFQDISEVVALRDRSRAVDRRLRSTLESMSDGFVMLDRDWRFTYVNRESERILGYRQSELLGRGHFEVFPESRGSPITAGYQRAFDSGEPARFTAFSTVLDRWLEVRAFPADDGLAIYFRDVTAEHARAEQLRLLEAAVAQQQDVLVITEAASIDAPDGPKVVYVNPAFERVTGFSRDEILGLTPRIQQGPKTQRQELDRIKAALAAGQPVRVEVINYRKDGSEYWKEMDIAPVRDPAGVITHWVAVYRDISERKATEEALRLSEERFRLVTQASNEAIWDWDLASGRIWWNENFTAIFGYPVHDVHSGYKRVHPEDRERVARSFETAISGTGSLWQEEFRYLKADGNIAQVRDRGFVLRDEQGAAVRMVGSMVDLTAEREAALRQRHLQKMEAIGQLTGGVAHDFNNLLTIILGNAELLGDALADRPDLLPLATVTMSAADRGAELTSRLLAFARRQSLEPKVCDINALIAGTDAMLRRTLAENIEIELVRSGGLWLAELDPGQLENAVLNLALNARDAMPDGGKLTIETGNAYLDQDYADRHVDVTAGQYVVLTVSDTGAGMTAEVVERAFEPFFSTKGEGKGSGLGLSMVYGFVKQSGGHIKIYAEPGLGTAIKLYFPRARQGATPAAIETERGTVVGGGEHVLVVEDEPLVRAHVESLLLGLGYRVTTAANGPAAMAVLERRADIDLLFTDVVMPGGMNGRELAEAAARLRPGLEVLFTSGYTENAIVHHGRLDPGVQLLSKPYRRRDLARKLRLVLDRRDPPAAAGEAAP